jgi:hypothetical protein
MIEYCYFKKFKTKSVLKLQDYPRYKMQVHD